MTRFLQDLNGNLPGFSKVALWKPPYRAYITKALKAGNDKLEIKVTNQWSNRHAGDRIVPQEERVLNKVGSGTSGFGIFGFGGRGSRLAPSGFIGPVKVLLRK